MQTSNPAEVVHSNRSGEPALPLKLAPQMATASQAHHPSAETPEPGLDPQANATAATDRPPLGRAASPCRGEMSPLVASDAERPEGNAQCESVNAASDVEPVREGSPGGPDTSEGCPGASDGPASMAPGVTSAEERLEGESPSQRSSLAAPNMSLEEVRVAEGALMQESASLAPMEDSAAAPL